MTCPNCGSDRINVQAVAEQDKRGCFLTGLMILLLFIPIVGWITLFILIRGRKTETKTYAVCQSCGFRFMPGHAPVPSPSFSKEPCFDTLIPNVQAALSHMFDEEVGVSENEEDWIIARDGLKYTLSSKVKIQDAYRHTNIEIDFPDENYDTFFVRRLEIDGHNIEI